MADPRFFQAAGPFSVAELAKRLGASIGGASNGALMLTDVAPLDVAGPQHLSFLSNPRYVDDFTRSAAGAALVRPNLAARAPASMTVLVLANPYMGFARAAQAFYPDRGEQAGLAPGAVVDPSAELGDDVSIGANAVIEAGVVIGAKTVIGANSVIGAGCVIGTACRIGANVTVSHAVIGNRVTLYPGARIGQDGFGFASDPSGHVKIPQLGRVIIEDGVEVGANSTIDRGAGPDTVIGAGTMIDNLVQIGHNVVMGRCCVMAAQSGISGSSHLGDFVQVGGQVGIAGHLKIGSGAMIAGGAGVMRDIAPGARFGGLPAVPMTQWHRQTVSLDRLTRKKDH